MSTPDTTVTGRCYCGGVTFAVSLPDQQAPIFSLYCHCESCRRAHAAPLYHVVCVDSAWFDVTSGQELITRFQRPGGSIARDFCSACGTRVRNRFPRWRPGGREPLAFFPNLLDSEHQLALSEALRPTGHNRSEECVLDLTVLAQLDTD